MKQLALILLFLLSSYIGKTQEKGAFIDERNSTEYKWIKIGKQIWMAENLAFLPSVSPSSEKSDSVPYYYVHSYEGSSVTEAKRTNIFFIYGVLYNWPAATSDNNVNGQDICPDGWHLPSDEEWTILTDYLISNGFGFGRIRKWIGKSMASTSRWIYSTNLGTVANDQKSNNSSGFNAFPGSACSRNGGFYPLGSNAFFWSSSEKGAKRARVHYLDRNIEGVQRGPEFRRVGDSVRCLKD